jgi:hypothetical protein
LNFPFLVGRCELTGRVDFSHAAGRRQDKILGRPKNHEKRRRSGEKEEREEEIRRDFLK